MSGMNNNPFLWKTPSIVNLSKYPIRCLDNNSIISFPEDAFYVFNENRSNNSTFCNVEYPSYPQYYLDVSHLFVKKRKMTLQRKKKQNFFLKNFFTKKN